MWNALNTFSKRREARHEEVAAGLLAQNGVRNITASAEAITSDTARLATVRVRASKRYAGAKVGLLAVKMNAYEWAFAISNCIASGGGLAAGIYWVSAGCGE